MNQPLTELPWRTRLYDVWYAMKQRCENPFHSNYKNYGRRGITVCSRWQEFTAFLADMMPGYQPGLELDRRDNNLGYEPANCRWVTKSANKWNRVTDPGQYSKYTGVYWNKRQQEWTASIKHEGKKIHLGRFATEKQAAKAYDAMCLELRGDFAVLNQDRFAADFLASDPVFTVTKSDPGFRTRLNAVWRAMKNRCDSPINKGYHNYGKKGIKYCDRWADFDLFYADMHPTYQPGLQLNRQDKAGPFSPENCMWSTAKQTARKKKLTTVDVTYTDTVQQAA